jgi:hypothetical protein
MSQFATYPSNSSYDCTKRPIIPHYSVLCKLNSVCSCNFLCLVLFIYVRCVCSGETPGCRHFLSSFSYDLSSVSCLPQPWYVILYIDKSKRHTTDALPWDFQQRQDIFWKTSKQALGPNQPRVSSFLGVILPRCKADHLPILGTGVKNEWSYASTSHVPLWITKTFLSLFCCRRREIQVLSEIWTQVFSKLYAIRIVRILIINVSVSICTK